MRLLKKLPKSTNTFIGKLYSKFPFSGVSHPIFIIGCGRSGTTIFGTALSRHKDITYLNPDYAIEISLPYKNPPKTF
jgi:hypothetical protein